MTLRVQLEPDGTLSIRNGGNIALLDVRCALGPLDAAPAEGTLRASPWEGAEGWGTREAREVFSSLARDDAGVAFKLTVEVEGDTAWIVAEAQRDLENLAVGDTFERAGLAAPAFSISPGLRALAVTYGLGRSGQGEIGGYWPEARTVPADALPSEALAPLVLYDGDSALAIAPASQFLTSALLRLPGGAARTLHGAVDAIPVGTRIETVVAAGHDVASALSRLGDALLARGGKARPSPGAALFTSRLGWWNAYGGFYTEPIRPLGENRLVELIQRLRRDAVPIGYVGLDLWYPYRMIGQALRFAPDPQKYGRGFAEIARRHGVSFVFHLSALSPDNVYGASGADPSFYAKVAAELRGQGGVAAWHDWLRTQQHLTSALRADPLAADRWFRGMGDALDREGLALLLCMQTMGMALASTTMPNALAARTAIDYLFGQPEALETLAALGQPGFRQDATSLADLRRQNLLLGSVLYALGLLPFHDLFLTQRHEGLGGASPRIEAALRALSCGPVGIGDGPGLTQVDLVRSLVSARGRLLQPDHAPYPVTATLGEDVEVYRTERAAGAARWEYVIALNVSRRCASFHVPHERDEVVVWDALRRRIAESMSGTLESGEAAVFVLAPLCDGLAPLGLVDKIVPAPAGVLRSAEARGAWRIELDAPGERFAWVAAEAPRVVADDGRELTVRGQAGLWTVEVPEPVSWLVATRR